MRISDWSSDVRSSDLHEAGQHRLERGKSSYGRTGTPTTFAFEETVAALEGGYGAVAVASGLQAVTVVLMAFATNGSHLLLPDSVYFPARRVCDELLRDLGVETTFYDPCRSEETTF